MAARTRKKDDAASGSEVAPVNEVRVVGRLSADPEHRELPSGDTVWNLRVVVRRPPRPDQRQSVDVVDCAVWAPRLQRSVGAWRAGDVVDVSGAWRRRFYRGAGGAASRVEVEVSRARVIRRRASG